MTMSMSTLRYSPLRRRTIPDTTVGQGIYVPLGEVLQLVPPFMAAWIGVAIFWGLAVYVITGIELHRLLWAI
jgi:hypothetical protein